MVGEQVEEKAVPQGILLNGQIPVNGAVLHLALTVMDRDSLRRFISLTIRPAALKLGFDIELKELPPTDDGPVAL